MCGVCMVKAKASHRSVGVQQKLKLAFSKVPAPVVKLDLGIDWPLTFQVHSTEPGAVLPPACWGKKPLRYHMHLQTAKKLNMWVCDFSFGVYVCNHYSGWLCMAKGKPSHKSVGVQQKMKLELSKSTSPSGQVRLGY